MERIVVEGIDGVGKSTTIARLESVLIAQGARVKILVEPGTTELGQYLRTKMKTEPTSDLERVLMMYLSRYSTLDTDESGYDYIISDRCWLSTVAYQCSANPDLLDLVMRLQDDYRAKAPLSTLFLIDGTPELARTRRGLRNTTDQLENFDRQQAEAMYQIYRSTYTVEAVDYVVKHPQLFKPRTSEVCAFACNESRRFFSHIVPVSAQWTTEHQVDFILRSIEQNRILDRGDVKWELAVK